VGALRGVPFLLFQIPEWKAGAEKQNPTKNKTRHEGGFAELPE
jgi:hypothetical protein